MKTNRIMILLVVVSAMGAVAGCLQREAIVKDMFLLDVQRSAASAEPTSGIVLAVQPFSIAPAFQGRGFVYRTDTDQYESDYYNEYFVSPAAMISELTRNWLTGSGIFTHVLSPVSSAEPTCLLEGHIRQMAVDSRDQASPKAVLEISFFLVERDKRNRTVLLHESYSAVRPLQEKTAPAYIDALNGCLRQILEGLEKDLATHALKP